MQKSEQNSPDQIQQAFAKLVREHRISLHWTQKELADKLAEHGVNMGPSAITRLEKGTRRGIKLSEATVIARVLGIDLGMDLESPASKVKKLRNFANHQLNESRRSLEMWLMTMNEIVETVRSEPNGIDLLDLDYEDEPKSAEEYLDGVINRIKTNSWKPVIVDNADDREKLTETVRAITSRLLAGKAEAAILSLPDLTSSQQIDSK